MTSGRSISAGNSSQSVLSGNRTSPKFSDVAVFGNRSIRKSQYSGIAVFGHRRGHGDPFAAPHASRLSKPAVSKRSQLRGFAISQAVVRYLGFVQERSNFAIDGFLLAAGTAAGIIGGFTPRSLPDSFTRVCQPSSRTSHSSLSRSASLSRRLLEWMPRIPPHDRRCRQTGLFD